MVVLTKTQVETLTQMADVSLKNNGISVFYETLDLLKTLRNPTSVEGDNMHFEIGDAQLKNIDKVLDSTLRVLGINSVDQVLNIVEAFTAQQNQPPQQNQQIAESQTIDVQPTEVKN